MKNLLATFFVVLNLCAIAQNIRVLDKTTLQPIPGVKVYSLSNTSEIKRTDNNGVVVWTNLDQIKTLVFEHAYFLKSVVNVDQIMANKYKVVLSESINEMDEVVASASKFEEKKGDVVQKIQVINSTELANLNQTSTADVMSRTGNVMVQKSQLGGGSPIIRGFETNRVLMVVDGVRMNNAIYRGGHLQNIVTLDNSIMDRVEVAFGPGSVVYGSDALGGVMHFYTKNPLLSSTDTVMVKASAYGRYMSAASGYAAHADVSVGNRRLGSLTSFTYSNFGDLRQGAVRSPYYPTFGNREFYVKRIDGKDSAFVNTDTNLQVGSGYQQYDILQKFQFDQNENVSHVINFQYSTSTDVPRYDRLTQISGGAPKFAEWYYGPQERMFASYTLNLKNKNKFYDNARIILGTQQIEESRHDRRFNKNFLNHRVENVGVYTFNADFTKQMGRNEFRYGLEAFYNDVKSTATVEDIVADTTAKLDTRYPDGGSSMQSVAAYITHTLELSEKWILNDGIRFTNIGLKANFNDKTFFPFDYNSVSQNNSAVSGSLGIIYKPATSWRITAGGSTGFRAPNVDDLSKVFESVPGNLLVPNPNLKPEYSFNTEVGISKTFHKRVTASVVGYYTWLNNALTVQPSQFNGQDSILYNGQMSAVTTVTNAAQAYIHGLEAGLSGKLNENVSIYGTLNYTYGRIETDTTDYPLDHIPPVFGKLGVNYKINKFRAEAFTQFSAWKRIEDYNLIGEDNISNATPVGMPAWYTLNARLNYQFNRYVGLQVACENILDHNYRVFASNISSPGRNFIATMRVNL